MAEGQDFGQNPPTLAVCIQEILDSYPEGQIMKELLQNAEDAGATELHLTLDIRQFDCQSLYHPDLDTCQGPALIAFNDAMFTANDWRNIQKTKQSEKKMDPRKIGRFGIGFNSVYHLTDFPWIVCKNMIGVFDPRQIGVFKDASGRPTVGRQWDTKIFGENFPDQFRPFGLAHDQSLQGTMFRFPLRQNKTPPDTALSDEIYTPKRIRKLFDKFMHDGERLLLFLSSVRKIILWEQTDTQKIQLYSLTQKNCFPDVVPQPLDNSSEFTYFEADVTSRTYDSKSDTTNDTCTRWAVLHYIDKNAQSPVVHMAQEMQLLPWVGVACPLDMESLENDRSYISCFLPLPPDRHIFTGLPVHIHGYFCLSNNRRAVLWPAIDHYGDKRVKWNMRLASDLLPVAYAHLVQKIAARLFSSGELHHLPKAQLIASLLPDLNKVTKPFSDATVTALCKRLAKEKLFWSSVHQTYVDVATAVFSLSEHLPESVRQLCQLSKLPLVELRESFVPELFRATCKLQCQIICPQYVVSELTRTRAEVLNQISTECRLELLSYLLSDANCKLHGVPLLLLSNGSFVSFEAPGRRVTSIFVASDEERSLLPGLESIILHRDCMRCLGQVIDSDVTQLRRIVTRDMPMLLKQSIKTGRWCAEELVKSLWSYINNHAIMTLGHYKDLPLLPIRNGCKNSHYWFTDLVGKPDQRGFAPLDNTSRLLSSQHLPEHLINWLTKGLGITLVDHPQYLPKTAFLCDYVVDASNPNQCLEAIAQGWRDDKSHFEQAIRTSKKEQIDWLRETVLASRVEESNEFEKFLRHLPILTPFPGQKERISAHEARGHYSSCPTELETLLKQIGFPSLIVFHKDPLVRRLSLQPLKTDKTVELLINKMQSGYYDKATKEKIMHWIAKYYEYLSNDAKKIVAQVDQADVVHELLHIARKKTIDKTMFVNCCSLLQQYKDFPKAIANMNIFVCKHGMLHDSQTIVMESSLSNACPYICTPENWIKERLWDLLKQCKAKEKPSQQDLVEVLNKMQNEHSSIYGKMLKGYIEVLMELKQMRDNEKTQTAYSIALPDSEGTLRSVEQLLIASSDTHSHMGDHFAVHRDIPHQLALSFGIKTLDDVMLDKFEVIQGGKEFGQEVDLVQRIRSLLEQYHAEKDLFQEFIQNADDAGATKISFFIDERQQRQFSYWEKLQGPGLLIYNNSIFKDEDIEGIQKLGIGSKVENKDKIGRYGAGFNCAYGYTDCPLFVSNNQDLCIFDPLRYVSKPYQKCGRQYTLTNSDDQLNFIKMYPELYDVFTVKGFPLDGGTMFRLPTGIQEIRKPVVTSQQNYHRLFESMAKAVPMMLLFLKNITEISAYHLNAHGQPIKLWHFKSIVKQKAFLPLKEFNMELQRNTQCPLEQIKVCKSAYQVSIIDMKGAEGKEQIWLVSQRLGFSATPEHNFKKVKLLPVAGVASRLDQKSMDNHMFCSLPLPQKTEIPVCINGHFALDSEGRKNLFTPTEGCNDLRLNWNVLLLNDIAANAYLDLLSVIRDEKPYKDTMSQIASYWNFLPRIIAENLKQFVLNFYHKLSTTDEKLIPCLCATSHVIMWLSIDGSDPKPTFPPTPTETYDAMFLFLRELGMHVTPAPAFVQNSLCDAEATLVRATPTTIAEFLRGSSSVLIDLECPVGHTVFKSEKMVLKLLQIIINDHQQTNTGLAGLPLLVTSDGFLRKFDQAHPIKLEHPKVAALFTKHPGQFVGQSLAETLKMHMDTLKKRSKSDPCLSELLLGDIAKMLPVELQQQHGINEIPDCSRPCIPVPHTLTSDWLQTMWHLFKRLTHNKQTTKTFVNTFKNWPLIPAQMTTDGPLALFTMNVANAIILSDVWENIRLGEAVRLMGIPIVRKTGNSELFKSDVSSLFCSAKNPVQLAKTFRYWNEQGTIQWPSDLSQKKEVAHEILKYFSSVKENALEDLRHLPLFEQIDGSFESVAHHERSCALEEKGELPPSAGKHLWMNKAIFLKKHDLFAELYKKLMIAEIKLPQLYSQFIVPTLPEMEVKDQVIHLDYIRTHQGLYPALQSSIDILRGLSFVHIKGEVKKLSEFASHYNPLFLEMCSTDRFLPDDYWTAMMSEMHDHNVILEFLAHLNFSLEPSTEDCIHFAMKLADMSLQVEEEKVTNAAKMLWRYLESGINKNKVKPSKENYNTLNTIKFIPSAEIKPELIALSAIHESTSSPRTLLCTKGVNHFTSMSLLWTTGKCLPDWVKGNDQFMQLMGILNDPPSDLVIDHFEKLLHALHLTKLVQQKDDDSNSPEHRETLDMVLKSFYSYLEETSKKQDGDVVMKRVARLPLVIVEDGRNLVYPTMVVERLPDRVKQGLPPFLFELPSELRARSSLFKQLGMEYEPTVKQYASLLDLVFEHFTKEGQLPDTPNILDLVMKAQKEIVILCAGITSESEDLWSEVQQLYLLGPFNRLCLSSQLKYSKENRFQNETPDVWPIPPEVWIESSSFIDSLPEKLKLTPLKLEERIDDTNSCKQSGCLQKEHLEAIFAAHSFIQALKRLNFSTTNNASLITDHEWEEIAKKLRSTVIVCYSKLTVSIVEKESCKPVGSKPKRCFWSDNSICVSHDAIEFKSALFPHDLSNCVKKLVRIELPQAPLAALLGQLLSNSDCLVDKVLDDLEIPQIPASQAKNTPLLGSNIPTDMVDFLEMHPLNFFRPGEYIGYLENPESPEKNFQWAKVIRCETETNSLLSEYKIDIGSKSMIVTGNDLYKFIINIDGIETGPHLALAESAEPSSETDEIPKNKKNMTLQEAKDEVRKILEEAWKQPQDERKKIIRRLYLAWHPDKNVIEDEQLATEVFKFLKQEIERLEKGLPADEEKFDSAKTDNSWSSYRSRGSRSSNTWNSYRNRRQNSGQNRSHFFNFSGGFNFYETPHDIPDQKMAKKYWEQAKHDLDAALSSFNVLQMSEKIGSEHVIFWAQQAIEKSLKAVLFSQIGRTEQTNRVTQLASSVNSRTRCPESILKLVYLFDKECQPDFTNLRYPRDQIPNEIYTPDQAQLAVRYCKEIINGLETAFFQ